MPNILAAARRPNFIWHEDPPWGDVPKTLKDFASGVRFGDPEAVTMEALSNAQKFRIASLTLLGNPNATEEADLIALPVVNPGTLDLNLDALRKIVAIELGVSIFPDSVLLSAQVMAKKLLSETETEKEIGAPEVSAMNSQRIAINSRTSGRVQHVTVNKRPHLKTSMRPIVGDTVMHGVLYPVDVVAATHQQLDGCPAPGGHPQAYGQDVMTTDPLGFNASFIGGFVMNPRMNGKEVLADFFLDKQIAESTDSGRAVIAALLDGEDIGVSTGIFVEAEAGSGIGEDGRAYNSRATRIEHDHVAILMGEEAEGAHVGTQIVYNSKKESVLICNVANSENKQPEEGKAMTNKEMIEKLEADNHRVFNSGDPQLKKLEIPDGDIAELAEFREVKAKKLSELRTNAAKALNVEVDILEGTTEEALESIIATNAAKAAGDSDGKGDGDGDGDGKSKGKEAMNHSLRGGGGGGDESKEFSEDDAAELTQEFYNRKEAKV